MEKWAKSLGPFMKHPCTSIMGHINLAHYCTLSYAHKNGPSNTWPTIPIMLTQMFPILGPLYYSCLLKYSEMEWCNLTKSVPSST